MQLDVIVLIHFHYFCQLSLVKMNIYMYQNKFTYHQMLIENVNCVGTETAGLLAGLEKITI